MVLLLTPWSPSVISKALDKLHQAIQPQSLFHVKRDVRVLHKMVSEVEELFGRLPKAQSGEVEFDMRMAKQPTNLRSRIPPFHWDEEKHRYVYDELKEELDHDGCFDYDD